MGRMLSETWELVAHFGRSLDKMCLYSLAHTYDRSRLLQRLADFFLSTVRD